MEWRNPAFTADGRIDVEIQHPRFGWIPFTASPDDPEPLGREVYAEAAVAEVAPYVAPVPDPADIAAELRAVRDARLRESDTDIVRLFLGENLPVPREWRDYRQALRDLPQQADLSAPIIWPGKPGT